jgi:uncharacterized protein (DUF983 family)
LSQDEALELEKELELEISLAFMNKTLADGEEETCPCCETGKLTKVDSSIRACSQCPLRVEINCM